MEQFISIDWGTSSLRCRVVNAESNGIEAEVCSEMGIAYVFENWNSIGKPEQERLSFYQAILGEEIKKLEKNMSERLDGLAVIISGMASANIGMKNLPYKVLPFSISGGDLGVEFINSTKDFNHNTLLVSGVRSDNDVMRGEETQLIGSVTGSNDEELYIFPGTHSKHMTVRNGQVNEFKTYMTGEVFSLLSTKSILSKSIEKVMQLSTPADVQSFERGIEDSHHENILNILFKVRVNELFQKSSKREGYCYLSGLLIGIELKDISIYIPCTIICDSIIADFYYTALKKIKGKSIRFVNAAEAIVKGHSKLFQHHKSRLQQAS